MKTRLMRQLTRYVFAMVFLGVACVGISIYVLERSGIDTATKILLMILLAVCVCLYTAFEITRYMASSMKKCIQELNEVSAYLKVASANMRGKANELEKNTVLLVKHIESAVNQEKNGNDG